MGVPPLPKKRGWAVHTVIATGAATFYCNDFGSEGANQEWTLGKDPSASFGYLRAVIHYGMVPPQRCDILRYDGMVPPQRCGILHYDGMVPPQRCGILRYDGVVPPAGISVPNALVEEFRRVSSMGIYTRTL